MHNRRLQPHWRIILLFFILNSGLLVGCSTAPPAQVADRDQPPSRKILVHRVSRGETLYSIAWSYGLDYRKLARHNGIAPPYTIYVSQRLRLDVNNQATAHAPPRAIARKSAQASQPQPKSRHKATKRSHNRTHATAPPASISGPIKWRWPARGKVIAGFTRKSGLNKGIDISGKLGEPVVAAGNGHVVYAGTGLRGYGKLLIIKHNATYLSAYAHNRVLLVKEGESVKAGQKIAEIGSSGTNKEKLHFEIRRNGKPVNPLSYLPSH